jgi:hypothetical protein
MYKRILLAYDGSESGQKALLDCQDLVQWSRAELVLVAVMPHHIDFIGAEGGYYDPKIAEREKENYRAILDQGLKTLADGRPHRQRPGADRRRGQRDHRPCAQDRRRPDRRRPQAPGRLGRTLVARLQLQRADRTCALQRAGGDHRLIRPYQSSLTASTAAWPAAPNARPARRWPCRPAYRGDAQQRQPAPGQQQVHRPVETLRVHHMDQHHADDQPQRQAGDRARQPSRPGPRPPPAAGSARASGPDAPAGRTPCAAPAPAR